MLVIEFISQPWHWSISGLGIVLVMFLLLYLGESFGVSSTFRALCAAGGAGKKIPFFDFDWKSQDWQLFFVIGAIIGGALSASIFQSEAPVAISQATVSDLEALGFVVPQSIEQGRGFIPEDIFNIENLMTFKGFLLMVGGGFLIGFGARYAGGCTSGHAISGLSNLQIPSLVAVIGFFIGGLIMTHVLYPIIF